MSFFQPIVRKFTGFSRWRYFRNFANMRVRLLTSAKSKEKGTDETPREIEATGLGRLSSFPSVNLLSRGNSSISKSLEWLTLVLTARLL